MLRLDVYPNYVHEDNDESSPEHLKCYPGTYVDWGFRFFLGERNSAWKLVAEEQILCRDV
jgi:hypothetical protein